MVWLAAVSLSSPGLSAVRRSRGTLLMEASTTAGNRLATAVPEEVMTAAERLSTLMAILSYFHFILRPVLMMHF